jgi:hypothetical protein
MSMRPEGLGKLKKINDLIFTLQRQLLEAFHQNSQALRFGHSKAIPVNRPWRPIGL